MAEMQSDHNNTKSNKSVPYVCSIGWALYNRKGKYEDLRERK
jgi:hypothetical protein